MASHTLKGASFIRFGEGEPEVHFEADWPTLCAEEIGSETILLGDRFAGLRFVNLSEGDPSTIATWPTEDVPNDILYREGRLYVAAGGTGVSIYEWSGSEQPPQLRGRFPFVDFSRELAIDAHNHLFVADNRDTGMQILDVTGIMRPTYLSHRMSGYVVSVALHEQLAFAADRRSGVVVYDVTDPANPTELGMIPRQNFTSGPENIVEEITTDAAGNLMVVESERPARMFRIDRSGETPAFRPQNAPPFTGLVLQQAIFLPEGRMAAISEQNKLIVETLTTQETESSQ